MYNKRLISVFLSIAVLLFSLPVYGSEIASNNGSLHLNKGNLSLKSSPVSSLRRQSSAGDYDISPDGKTVSVNVSGTFTWELANEIATAHSGITSLTLGADVNYLEEDALTCFQNLKSVSVDALNKKFSTQDDILYNWNMTTLVYIPIEKPITSYVCPDSVDYIEKAAINGNYLTSVTIGENVWRIDVSSAGSMFEDVPALTNIYVEPGNRYFCSEDGILYDTDKSIIVKYPAAKKGKSFTFPSTIKQIGKCAFDDNQNLTEVVLNDGLTTINDQGFSVCSNLEKITIPKSLTTTGILAFFGIHFKEAIYNGTEAQWDVFYSSLGTADQAAFENASVTCTEKEKEIEYEDYQLGSSKTIEVSSVYTSKPFSFEKYYKIKVERPCDVDFTVYATGSIVNAEIYDSSNTKLWIWGLTDNYESKSLTLQPGTYYFKWSGCVSNYPDNVLGSATLDSSILKYLDTDKDTATVSDNKPMGQKTVNIGEFQITYFSQIPFFGKKPKLENFGKITVSGNTTSVSSDVIKVKINKKRNVIQIKDVSGFSKADRKAISKATKGSSGLSYTVNSYWVKDTDDVAIKRKGNNVRSVKVKINGKYYKCKKSEWSYDSSKGLILFSGNLTGSYKVS